MRTHRLWTAAALAALAGACSDSGTGVSSPDGGMAITVDGGAAVAALFEVPAAGQHPSEFYALPFPNDLRLNRNRSGNADGTMDLADYPRPSDLIGRYIDIFAADTGGFGTNSAIYFRFSGPIDPATLPATP